METLSIFDLMPDEEAKSTNLLSLPAIMIKRIVTRLIEKGVIK